MDGIRDLFWNLVEPEHLKARAFCRKLMGSREDGDDLYQDCLVIALTRFADLRDNNSFKPWLYRIIVNGFKNRVRTPWWKKRVDLTAEIEQAAAGDGDPTSQYSARRKLEIAFKAVTVEERVMVTLFELQGWTIAELARLYDKTEGNIKVRLSRARKKMRAAVTRTLAPRRRTTEKTRHKEAETLKAKDRICVATKHGES